MSSFSCVPMELDNVYFGEEKRIGFVVCEDVTYFLNGDMGVDIHLAYILPDILPDSIDSYFGRFVPVHYVDEKLCAFPAVSVVTNLESLYSSFLRALERRVPEKIYTYVSKNYTNFHLRDHFEKEE